MKVYWLYPWVAILGEPIIRNLLKLKLMLLLENIYEILICEDVLLCTSIGERAVQVDFPILSKDFLIHWSLTLRKQLPGAPREPITNPDFYSDLLFVQCLREYILHCLPQKDNSYTMLDSSKAATYIWTYIFFSARRSNHTNLDRISYKISLTTSEWLLNPNIKMWYP